MTEVERIEERLKAYYDAELAILSSQSYTIGGQTLTRANLSDVRQMIDKLEADLRKAKSAGANRKTKRVVPMDF